MVLLEMAVEAVDGLGTCVFCVDVDVTFRGRPLFRSGATGEVSMSLKGVKAEISFTPNAAVFLVDAAIQPEVPFIAKQNSLMKIENNGNLVLGPFDESTPCLMIVWLQLLHELNFVSTQTKILPQNLP
ncbi:hypothetical protein TNCV_4376101 [Trichonephila clavipes]|nr:hypothetical protein TNCV_4376101 [Trichonephila clavipes]